MVVIVFICVVLKCLFMVVVETVKAASLQEERILNKLYNWSQCPFSRLAIISMTVLYTHFKYL